MRHECAGKLTRVRDSEAMSWGLKETRDDSLVVISLLYGEDRNQARNISSMCSILERDSSQDIPTSRNHCCFGRSLKAWMNKVWKKKRIYVTMIHSLTNHILQIVARYHTFNFFLLIKWLYIFSECTTPVPNSTIINLSFKSCCVFKQPQNNIWHNFHCHNEWHWTDH